MLLGAVKLNLKLIMNLLVNALNSPVNDELPGVINFNSYLKDYPKRNEPKTRIINLCDSQAYLSKGYYCSLLAAARSHKVVPSVKTLNTLRNQQTDLPFLTLVADAKLKLELAEQRTIYVFFGRVDKPEIQKLVNRIYGQLQTPLLKLTIELTGDRLAVFVEQLCLSDLPAEQRVVFSERLQHFSDSIWTVQGKKKQARWDMVILVNPEEEVPPSDKSAITHMIRAAAKQGIHAEALSVEQISNIGH